MKQVISRLLFVILSTAVMVFFSEKAFWYPQGYAIAELILFYGVIVFAVMWMIDFFRVKRLASLVLIAAMFAFLTEGVLTPILYEAGLFDPLLPAYFIGWHGLLGVVFGWYFLRKWLLRGAWLKLISGAVLFGLFWGMWAITYWLPENFDGFARPGQWPTVDFGLHALTFTLMLMAAHWLLGRSGWQTEFKPSRYEKWVLAAALLFLYATLSFPAAPLGFLKLGVLTVVTLLPLWANRRREEEGSLLADLSGAVSIKRLLPLLLMPLLATAVYGAAASFQLSEDLIRTILELTPLVQGLAGFVAFVWALVVTIRPSPTAPKVVREELV